MSLQNILNQIMGVRFETPQEAVADYTLNLIQEYKQFCENNPVLRYREQYNLGVVGIQETCAIFDLAWHPYVDMFRVGVMNDGNWKRI